MTSMASRKAKGRESERLVAEYLTEALGCPVERRRLAGSHDRGDLSGIPGWMIEVKSSLSQPAALLDQIEAQTKHAGARYGAGIVRRKGTRNVGDWYAMINVGTLVDLIRLSWEDNS